MPSSWHDPDSKLPMNPLILFPQKIKATSCTRPYSQSHSSRQATKPIHAEPTRNPANCACPRNLRNLGAVVFLSAELPCLRYPESSAFSAFRSWTVEESFPANSGTSLQRRWSIPTSCGPGDASSCVSAHTQSFAPPAPRAFRHFLSRVLRAGRLLSGLPQTGGSDVARSRPRSAPSGGAPAPGAGAGARSKREGALPGALRERAP